MIMIFMVWRVTARHIRKIVVNRFLLAPKSNLFKQQMSIHIFLAWMLSGRIQGEVIIIITGMSQVTHVGWKDADLFSNSSI